MHMRSKLGRVGRSLVYGMVFLAEGIGSDTTWIWREQILGGEVISMGVESSHIIIWRIIVGRARRVKIFVDVGNIIKGSSILFFFDDSLGDSGGGIWNGKVKNHERAAIKFQARSEKSWGRWPFGN